MCNYTHAGCSLSLPALPPSPPPPPKVAARGKTSLTLRWNAPADNGSPITQYCLEWDQVRSPTYMHATSQHLKSEREGRRGRGGGRREESLQSVDSTLSLLHPHSYTFISSPPHLFIPSPLHPFTQCGEEFTSLYNGKEKHHQFKRRFPPGSLALFRVKACNSVGWR